MFIIYFHRKTLYFCSNKAPHTIFSLQKNIDWNANKNDRHIYQNTIEKCIPAKMH